MEFNYPELDALEESKAIEIRKSFSPMVVDLEQLELEYRNIIKLKEKGIDQMLTHQAKELRKKVGKVRIEIRKEKDKRKEHILKEGKAIQSVHNVLVAAVSEREEALKAIENHFEIEEQKRIDSLQEKRESELRPYVDEMPDQKFGEMDEDVWQAYLQGKQSSYADRKAAEIQARVQRKKDEAEQERIRKDNEKLLAENAAKQKIIDDKIEKERLQKEAEEKKIQDELSKGDSEKMKDLVADLQALKTKYEFKSLKSKAKYAQVGDLIDKIVKFI